MTCSPESDRLLSRDGHPSAVGSVAAAAPFSAVLSHLPRHPPGAGLGYLPRRSFRHSHREAYLTLRHTIPGHPLGIRPESVPNSSQTPFQHPKAPTRHPPAPSTHRPPGGSGGGAINLSLNQYAGRQRVCRYGGMWPRRTQAQPAASALRPTGHAAAAADATCRQTR